MTVLGSFPKMWRSWGDGKKLWRFWIYPYNLSIGSGAELPVHRVTIARAPRGRAPSTVHTRPRPAEILRIHRIHLYR